MTISSSRFIRIAVHGLDKSGKSYFPATLYEVLDGDKKILVFTAEQNTLATIEAAKFPIDRFDIRYLQDICKRVPTKVTHLYKPDPTNPKEYVKQRMKTTDWFTWEIDDLAKHMSRLQSKLKTDPTSFTDKYGAVVWDDFGWAWDKATEKAVELFCLKKGYINKGVKSVENVQMTPLDYGPRGPPIKKVLECLIEMGNKAHLAISTLSKKTYDGSSKEAVRSDGRNIIIANWPRLLFKNMETFMELYINKNGVHSADVYEMKGFSPGDIPSMLKAIERPTIKKVVGRINAATKATVKPR